MKCLAFSILIFLFNQITVFSQDKSQEKVNLLLIHVDDLGWADIGAMGSDFYETPNIDKLAAEGMLFTNSYAAAAICSPTRAALLTGKYPARIGITDWIRAKFQGVPNMALTEEYEDNPAKGWKTPANQGFLKLEETTLAERLAALGYINLHVGKWHLGESGHYPEDQGFNFNVGGNDLGQPPSYFDPYLPKTPRKYYAFTNLPPRKTGEFLMDREGDEVVDFLQKHAKNNFFIHWAPYAVHTPIMGKPELIEKYQSKAKGNQVNPVYAALVQSLDENVGKVIAALENLGISDRTLVIFTSDNGGLIGNPSQPITNNYPLRSQKGYPYEGGIRIPTIVKWPGQIKPGQISEIPIISVDWVPTIMEILGEKQPEGILDGVSLVSLLQDKDPKISRDLFWHFPHYRESDIVPYAIVRSGEYKLIHYFDGSKSELYNLRLDPSEGQNIIEEEKIIAQNLLQKLKKWLSETGARLPLAMD